MKTGLVMEGGAMRGLFTAGAIDVMLENGLRFDGAVGVSAGAAFGCNLKSRQPGRVLRYNLKYCRDPRFCGLRSLVSTGDLFGADFCYREIPEKLDVFDAAEFERNPMEFYVVCTDALTGEAVYRRCVRADRECLEWIRASASMPLVSRAVGLDGRKLLDGGIADSVPLRFFERLGYEKNVVLLTRPADYIKRPSRLLPLIRLRLRKYPRLVEALGRRHEVYNETVRYIARREREGAVLALRPDAPLDVGRVERDPDKLRGAYAAGREVCLRRLGELRDFLGAEK